MCDKPINFESDLCIAEVQTRAPQLLLEISNRERATIPRNDLLDVRSAIRGSVNRIAFSTNR